MAADAGVDAVVDAVAAVAAAVAVGLASPPRPTQSHPRSPRLPQPHPQARRPLLTADGTW